MDIDSIFKQIKFDIKPSDDYRKAYLFRFKKGLSKLINLDKKFTFNNCILDKSVENENLKNALLKIDSMSTYAIGHLVNQICLRLSENQIYLNIENDTSRFARKVDLAPQNVVMTAHQYKLWKKNNTNNFINYKLSNIISGYQQYYMLPKCFRDIGNCSPKLVQLYQNISHNTQYKHFIYSNFDNFNFIMSMKERYIS